MNQIYDELGDNYAYEGDLIYTCRACKHAYHLLANLLTVYS